MKRLSIFILIMMGLFITGCSNNKEKMVISSDKFVTVLSNKEFIVKDNMANYSDADYIIEAKKAVLDNIEIEFIRYSSNEYAKKVQDKQIDNFILLKNAGSRENKEEGKNYYKYFLISNNRYMINTRVDDTLVFCKTMLENKDTVNDIYNELGY